MGNSDNREVKELRVNKKPWFEKINSAFKSINNIDLKDLYINSNLNPNEKEIIHAADNKKFLEIEAIKNKFESEKELLKSSLENSIQEIKNTYSSKFNDMKSKIQLNVDLVVRYMVQKDSFSLAKKMKPLILATSLCTLLFPTNVLSNNEVSYHFCKRLENEVSKNLLNRNKNFIPSFVGKLINEEIVLREIVSKTLTKELEVKNNGFLTNSKCLFLYSVEKFGGKAVSKKYEEIVFKKFEEITDNFKTFFNKDIIDQIK